MATEVFQFTGVAGTTHYLAIFNSSGQVLDFNDNTFKALSGATTPYVAATERTDMGGAKSGFTASVDLANVNSTATVTKYFADWFTNTGLTTCVSNTVEFAVASSALVVLGQNVSTVIGTVGSVTGAVGSVTGAVGSVTGNVGGNVTGNVGGNVTGSVGSVATGGIAAASFASGAITAAAIAADAITDAKVASDVTIASVTGSVGSVVGSVGSVAAGVTLATSQPNYAPSKAGDAMTLTSGERTSIANEVETQIIDDTDSEKVLTAITDKIASVNPSLGGLTLSAIASQVRTELTTELARIDVATSTRLATSGYTAPTTPPTAAAIRSEMDANSTKLAAILEDTGTTLPATEFSANVTKIYGSDPAAFQLSNAAILLAASYYYLPRGQIQTDAANTTTSFRVRTSHAGVFRDFPSSALIGKELIFFGDSSEVMGERSKCTGVASHATPGNIVVTVSPALSAVPTVNTEFVVHHVYPAVAGDEMGLANGAITAAKIGDNAITNAKVADDLTVGSVTGAVGSVTGAVGSVLGAVGSVTAGVTLATSHDLYHADIHLDVDEATETDEYTVTWFKNGVRVTSGVTVPTLQIIKRADGSNLLAATSMTQVGLTGSYKLDCTTTNRITAGESVIVVAVATIDGSGRSFSRVIGRDSEAG